MPNLSNHIATGYKYFYILTIIMFSLCIQSKEDTIGMALFVLYDEVSLSEGLTRGMHMCSSHSCIVVMARRFIVGAQETEMLEVNSYIREYHVYKAVWKQLVAKCYVWRGNTVINKDSFVVAILN